MVNRQAFLTLTWSSVSLVAGAASDRIGRRPVLVAALLARLALRQEVAPPLPQ